MPFRGLLSLLLVFGVLIGTAIGMLAQADPTTITDDQVMDVARSLYCPVCPNEPLDTCQTEACYRWREDIRQQLAAGRTHDQIIADFVARYGERASAVPLDPTLNALSLVTPFVIAAIALALGAVVVLRWRRRQPLSVAVSSSPMPADASAYRARLEEDVRS
jgi:cytochrome c-type biogenesis protein CcmH